MTIKRITGVQFFRTNKIIEDMLRYDTAFAADKFPGIVCYIKFRGYDGTWGGTPTVERWRSFVVGFDPTPLTFDQISEIGIRVPLELMYEHGWYTVKDGQRVSLYDYMNGIKKKGEDWRDVS